MTTSEESEARRVEGRKEQARRLWAATISSKLGVTLEHAYRHYAKDQEPPDYFVKLREQVDREWNSRSAV